MCLLQLLDYGDYLRDLGGSCGCEGIWKASIRDAILPTRRQMFTILTTGTIILVHSSYMATMKTYIGAKCDEEHVCQCDLDIGWLGM